MRSLKVFLFPFTSKSFFLGGAPKKKNGSIKSLEPVCLFIQWPELPYFRCRDRSAG